MKDFDEEEFYGPPIGEVIILNRWKYKGRGRPRKTDYITIQEFDKRRTHFINQYLEAIRFNKPKTEQSIIGGE